jgi:outer membrane autotransporter protein
MGYTGSNYASRSFIAGAEGLNAAGLNKLGAQLAPSTNAASESVTFGTVQKAVGTVIARNDNVRFAQNSKRGVSSGEALAGYGFWAQGFGMTGKQNAFDNVDGYSSKTFGTAFGGDTRVLKKVRVGASMAFANTHVNDSGSREGSTQKINSYIGSLYGSYLGGPWFVDANAIFGIQTNKSARLVNFADGTSETANGSFNSNQYGFDLGVGYPIPVASRTFLTPVASILYTHLNQDAYTETGAPVVDLSVNANSTDSFVSATGLKFASMFGTLGGWTITPNARLIWLHEFNNKAMDQTSTFTTAGGSSFVTPGAKLPTETGEIGAGVDFAYKNGWTASAKYDLELRQGYFGNGGMFQVRKDF